MAAAQLLVYIYTVPAESIGIYIAVMILTSRHVKELEQHGTFGGRLPQCLMRAKV